MNAGKVGGLPGAVRLLCGLLVPGATTALLVSCGARVEDIGEKASAVHLSTTQFLFTDWWRPPEWTYSPAGTSLTGTMQSLNDGKYVLVPPTAGYHCGSGKFIGLSGSNTCSGYSNIKVTHKLAVVSDAGQNIQYDVYWQQPGGGAFAIVGPVTIFAAPPHAVTVPYILTQNPVTGAAFTPQDLGCNGGQPPIIGYCVHPIGNNNAVQVLQLTITPEYDFN